MRFLPGCELGRPPGAQKWRAPAKWGTPQKISKNVCGLALNASVGRGKFHPSDWVGLGAKGALPRALSAKQPSSQVRSLDHSRSWELWKVLDMAWARAQLWSTRPRWSETQLEAWVALLVASSTPSLCPFQQAAGMQPEATPLIPPENTAKQRMQVPGACCGLGQGWPRGTPWPEREAGARLPGQECGG